MSNDKYMKVIEQLGEALISKDLDLSILKYENEKLREKIKAIEEYCNYYEKSCEDVNNEEEK